MVFGLGGGVRCGDSAYDPAASCMRPDIVKVEKEDEHILDEF